jgi:hypothetical protein
MLHPNQVAIDYIWERFVHQFLKVLIHNEGDCNNKIVTTPFFQSTIRKSSKFESNLQNKISKISSRYPHMKF